MTVKKQWVPNHKTAQKSITFLRSSDIKNLRKDYYKIAQVLQICAKIITFLRRYYKSAQLLQICAQHMIVCFEILRWDFVYWNHTCYKIEWVLCFLCYEHKVYEHKLFGLRVKKCQSNVRTGKSTHFFPVLDFVFDFLPRYQGAGV